MSGSDPKVLTPKCIEILRLVSFGHSNKEVGRKLFISRFTVKNHLQQIMRKLDAHNRTAAVSKARALKLLDDVGPLQERPHVIKPLEREVEPITWFSWGDLLLCPEMHILKIRGEVVETSTVLFRLIHYFLTHPFTVHDCDALIQNVWLGENRTNSSVRVFIAKMRELLTSYGYGDFIETVRDEGYRVAHKYGVTIQKGEA